MRLLAFLLVFLAAAASAQGSYTTTQTLTLNGTTPCTSPSVRNITVGDSFTLADVNLGFFATHTWRGDIRLDLVSPQGTSVRLIASDTSTAGSTDNYNLILDDEAGIAYDDTAPGSTTAPPYDGSATPANPLSAFDGENALGTWELRLCDDFPTADAGIFRNAELILSPVAAPAAPTLACPAGLAAQQLTWTAPGGTAGWPAGFIGTQSYTLGSLPVEVTIAEPSALHIARNGTATPVTDTGVGGTTYHTLVSRIDFTAPSETITYTLALGTPGEGVAGVQFALTDVDRREGAWQDRVDVAASLGGATVPVTITPTDGANYVLGASVRGLAPIDTSTAGGEATVTVESPLDTLVLTYTPGPSSPANPDAQVMSFDLVDVCPLALADLLGSKSVAVVGGGFAVPGAEIEYTLQVENPAESSASATAIDLADTLPDSVTFLSATATGFTGGAFAPALPAANTDCAGGACVVSFAGAALAPGETGTLSITAQLK